MTRVGDSLVDALRSLDPESGPFAKGRLLAGRYRVHQLITRGGMGWVYLSLDENLRRRVAVKALAACTLDPTVDVRSEALSMAAVQHPNVVQVFSHGVEKGWPYLVMEFIDGESLAEMILRRQVEQEFIHLDEAIGILGQVCRGLDAIHNAGVTHCDITPDNILIDADYRVVITDFGMARRGMGREHDSALISGTVPYIAPELIQGTRLTDDARHLPDVYALGVILYELLTFHPPFDDPQPTETLQKHLRHPVPTIADARPDLPIEVDEVIRSAMMKRPSKRFQSADEFFSALHRIRPRSSGLASFLLVGHNPVEALALTRILRLAYPISTMLLVSTGDEALAFARDQIPTVIIVNADSREVDTVRLCVELQRERLLSRTRVVLILESLPSPDERKRLIGMGVGQILARPTRAPELLKAIDAAVEAWSPFSEAVWKASNEMTSEREEK